MKLSPFLIGLMLTIAAPACATPGTSAQTVEQKLAQCIYDAEPKLLVAIRDAASEQEFIAAFDRGLELCPANAEQLSMGKFFSAINALIGPPESAQ